MDALRSMKKGMRTAKRKASRSVHEALHNLIEEHSDLQKTFEHVAMEHEDCTRGVWERWAGESLHVRV